MACVDGELVMWVIRLNEIESAGLIKRIEVDGQPYGLARHFYSRNADPMSATMTRTCAWEFELWQVSEASDRISSSTRIMLGSHGPPSNIAVYLDRMRRQRSFLFRSLNLL
jgi:hypothetical protein